MLTRRATLFGGSAAIIAGAAPRTAWGRTEADVLIIGAGLAGLSAALMLNAGGIRTVVIEGERRVGGRLHTLDDLPGRPEAGGIQVGKGYTRLRSHAADLRIALNEGPGNGAGAVEGVPLLFHINGALVTAKEWPTANANRLTDAERSILPSSLGFRLGGKMPSLPGPAAWLDADPALDISYAEALRSVGASGEAMRLIAANLNGNSLASMSQMSLMRTAAIFRAGPGPTATIAGGSQRLPEAMAARLSSFPRLGTVVRSIRESRGGIRIDTNRGPIHARHIICTIPFAALRSIHIEADIDPSMAAMIADLSYTRASFVYLQARTPFWRDDGLGETLWTDDPMLGRIFVLSDDPPVLKLWTTGAGADWIDRLPTETGDAQIIARIGRARPSAAGQLRVLRRFSWQNSAMVRGIYHHIGTGQTATLAAATRSIGRHVHFAGEHLAQSSSGMEAAIESGERAAAIVLNRH